MIELLRSNDLVLLSWATATLRAHGIDTLLLDHHAAAIEGSIGAIPRRLMVLEEEAWRARSILEAERRALEADDG